ncbi:hypothetical protein [Deinococcus sp. Leaf326]|uniref:hypothetical protein n=1 Tax=Deinococcus sp. Leaf326 TaxID=1736338 RepID=UPI000A995935|nr:hypothetical protein [Deinococcus sp. Leaf326]
MNAGPYPTKAMHMQLKTRVTNLENGGGSGAGLVGNVDGLPLILPTMQRIESDALVRIPVSEGAPPTIIETMFEYMYYTLPVQQYSLSTIELRVPSTYDHVAHPLSFMVGSAGTQYGQFLQIADLQVAEAGAMKQLIYRFRRPTILYGGFIQVNTPKNSQNIAYSLPVFDLSNMPPSPAGLSVRTYGDNNMGTSENRLSHGFGIELEPSSVYPMHEVGGVLHPRQFPVFLQPTPQNPGQNTDSGLGLETGVEVVWPADGTPYLHVYRRATYGNAGQHYHLPLTPGLPQGGS